MPRTLPITLTAVLSLAVALVSWRFIAIGLQPAFPQMSAHIDHARLAFLAHVVFAPVALGLGAVQFYPGLRRRRPQMHRWIGRSYGVAILIAGLGSLGMTATSNGGIVAQLGFGLLALVWLASTALGVRQAMARRFDAHRRWMIRSFALTFAAVTLRLYMPGLIGSGMPYEEAIAVLAWACWVPNLAVAELFLRRNEKVVA